MSWCLRWGIRFVCLLGLLVCGSVLAEGQTSSDPAEDIIPAAIGAARSPVDAPKTAGPDKRVFGVLPNYRTAKLNGVYAPITAKRKLYIATKDTIDYPLFFLGGAVAGFGQVADEHTRFGQGLKGYGHRYITSYADQAIGNYMTEGIMPALLHEDPRYFMLGPEGGSVGYRAWYAASRIFVTKTDSGRSSFNFAEVLGNSVGAAVGNAYYPGETHLTDNVGRLAQALATDSVSQVLKEFWPDIKRKFFTRHKDSNLLPASSIVGQ